MPLVRIDLPRAIEAHTALRIGEVVHTAMTEVINVPRDDKFQIISRQAAEERNLTAEYLGIRYSDQLILIQITLNHGRTLEQKKAFYRRVAGDLSELGVRPQDVFINLVEVARENWSFGNGEMQYAPASPS
ncbi:MAG: tautomerase family protein [Gammaproteobacteria bacterium]|nr:tautomerase family protein [Gammaproteobacteria bacterium]MBV9726599.1 tautomerase family protein [Gammaproteobacteria bacterium]